jgi:putative DNA primase/helicase
MKHAKYQNVVALLDDDIEARSVPDSVLLACGADLTPQPVRWLWQYWLALGKLHILAGAPGQGKTTIALAMAATVTIGGRWPDGSRCEAGNVLIWSGEDDPADTLLPRLLASGADRSRCHFIKGAMRGGEVVPFDPARDLQQLRQAIDHIGGIRLLIVDPVVSAVTGDSHKNTEVRRALQPLVDMADACNCAVLGITHFAKGGQGTDPAQRVVGSVAFTAVARIVMVAAKVKGEEGQDARILARGKSNIGPDDGGFEYHLEQREPIPGIPASCIAWGKAVQGTARELLTDPDDQPQEDSSDAAELLRAELDSVIWTSSDEAAKPLKAAGFSKKQIWAASKKVGVMRKKDGMKGGWLWRLRNANERAFTMLSREDSTEGSEDSCFENVEPSESSGALESSVTEVL